MNRAMLTEALPAMGYLFLGGAGAAFLHDLRHILSGGRILSIAADILWMLASAALLLWLLVRGNGGELRWYILPAALSGVWCWQNGILRKILQNLFKKMEKTRSKSRGTVLK